MASGAIPLGKNDQVKASPTDASAGFLEDKVTSSDGSVDITTTSCGCEIDLSVSGVSGITEQWLKTTVSYTDFSSVSNTATITPTEFDNLPAGTVLLYQKMKHSTPFTGGSTSDADMRLRLGTLSLATLDVFQASADTTGLSQSNITSLEVIPDHASTSSVDVRLTINGDICDNLTAGAAEIWIKIATLV